MKGIIFDFDGLILDTELPVYRAWAECYADHGHELPLATYTQCVGSDFGHYNPVTELERLTGETLDWARLDMVRRDRVRELLEGAEALPGVEALLEEAKGEGVACAVASSSPRAWVVPWLERLELAGFFAQIVTLDDVNRPKPAPELFNLALDRLGIGPAEAVILEDSLNGLRAAQAAGIACVAVPNEVTSDLDFGGAARRVSSLREVNLAGLRAILNGVDRASGG